MDLLDLLYFQSNIEPCTDLVFIAKFNSSLWLGCSSVAIFDEILCACHSWN